MTDTWHKHFVVRQCRNTFYVARRGNTHNPPISPDFPTKGAAKAWIRPRWQEMMIEEILLK